MGSEEGEGGVAFAVGHGGISGFQLDNLRLSQSMWNICVMIRKIMASAFICHKSGWLRSGSFGAALIG